MSTSGNAKRHAIVLSGGGAHGAYEIGVLQALFADPSIVPEVCSGTSVGAFNAAVLVSRTNGGDNPARAVAGLETTWTETIAGNSYRNGVFRVRADPRPFLDPRCLASDPLKPFQDSARDAVYLSRQYAHRWLHFLTAEGSWEQRAGQFSDLSDCLSTAPFLALVRDAVDPARIAAGPCQLRIAATSLETGAVRIFDNRDFDGDGGHDAVVASGSIPIVFPPHQVGGEWFVDGAVRMNTPLAPAIHAVRDREGDDLVLHTIVLDPGVKQTPIPLPHNTLAMFDRLYGMLMSHAAERDIRTAARINDALHLRRIVEPLAGPTPADAGTAAADEATPSGRAVRRLTELVCHPASRKLTDARRPLTIHRYHPVAPLSDVMGLLDFSRDNVESLIARGRSDAEEHDCARNECVIPGR